MGGAYLEAEPELSLRPRANQDQGDKATSGPAALPQHNGTAPQGKRWSSYCKLSMAERRQVPPPAHKKREKRAGGADTGDCVKFEHQGVVTHGYRALSNGQAALTTPKWGIVKAGRAEVIERGHGYRVEHPRHETHL